MLFSTQPYHAHKLGMPIRERKSQTHIKLRGQAHIKLHQPAFSFMLHKLGMLTLQNFISEYVQNTYQASSTYIIYTEQIRYANPPKIQF